MTYSGAGRVLQPAPATCPHLAPTCLLSDLQPITVWFSLSGTTYYLLRYQWRHHVTLPVINFAQMGSSHQWIQATPELNQANSIGSWHMSRRPPLIMLGQAVQSDLRLSGTDIGQEGDHSKNRPSASQLVSGFNPAGCGVHFCKHLHHGSFELLASL